MTNYRNAVAIGAMLVWLAAPVAGQRPEAAQAALKAAIDKEMVDGDLKGAIALYERAVGRARGDRATAAKALIRMAECHQKLGSAESRKIYQRVLREYSDQKEAAEIARRKIGEGSAKNAGIITRQVWTRPKADSGSGSVSPDGRYLSFADEESGDLALHDLTTGEDRRLTHHAAGERREFADFSKFSPDGKQIVYVWYNSVDRGFELRLIPVSGGNHRVLFKNADVRYPGPWAWSADGKWIGVQLQRTDHQTVQVALLSPVDGTVRVLKSLGWGGAGSMAFSPDGKYLAYAFPSGQEAGRREVFALATDGSRENPIVLHPNSSNQPVAWTPDGKHLLFLSNRSGDSALWAVATEDGRPQGTPRMIAANLGEIWGMTRGGSLYYQVNSNGTEVYTSAIDTASGKLLSSPAPEYRTQFIPRWSPDGMSLAYGVLAPLRIRIRSVATGQAREVRPQMRYINDWVWSPDVRSFFMAGADLKGRHGIYRLDADSGDVQPVVLSELVAGGRNIAGQPRLTPDGKTLLYRKNFRKQGDTAVSEATLVARDLGSSTERVLVARKKKNPGYMGFAPSPDGRTVALQSWDEDNGTSGIVLLSLESGEQRQLLHATQPEAVEFYDWTPDGLHLIVRKVVSAKASALNLPANVTAGAGELLLLPVTGGSPRKLALDDPRARWVSIHPDGKRIAYLVEGADKSEVVAMDNLLSALDRSR